MDVVFCSCCSHLYWNEWRKWRCWRGNARPPGENFRTFILLPHIARWLAYILPFEVRPGNENTHAEWMGFLFHWWPTLNEVSVSLCKPLKALHLYIRLLCHVEYAESGVKLIKKVCWSLLLFQLCVTICVGLSTIYKTHHKVADCHNCHIKICSNHHTTFSTTGHHRFYMNSVFMLMLPLLCHLVALLLPSSPYHVCRLLV